LEDELVALDKETGGLFGGTKFEPAEFRKSVLFGAKVEKYQKAIAASASAEELAKLEKELATDAPKGFDLKQLKDAIAMQAETEKISGLLDDYMEAVGAQGDATKAAELGRKVAALEIKSPQLLNQIAWIILTDENVKQRDLALATKLAAAGVKASEGKDAAVLDTYARALFDSGKIKEAIEQQQKAVDVAESEDLKSELKATLKKYQDKVATKPVAGA
jgi:tetratricopeptide (TPR) repeat protein